MECLYSLGNELLTQHGKSRLPWKQNVDVHKWDPNVSDFRYRNINCHVSNSTSPKVVLTIQSSLHWLLQVRCNT